MEKLPEAVDTLLEWRSNQAFNSLSEEEGDDDEDGLKIIQCLTPPARDRLGRPVALVKLSNVQGTPAEMKQYILSRFERLRLALVSLNEQNPEDTVLQYVFIVDIANASGMSVVSVLY
jgi:hypothetical protein